MNFLNLFRKQQQPVQVSNDPAAANNITDQMRASVLVGRPAAQPVGLEFEDAKAWKVYRDMRRDPIVASCADLKCASTVQHGWQIEPADDSDRNGEIAEFIETALDRIGEGGLYEVIDKMLDGVCVGRSIQEKCWGEGHDKRSIVNRTISHDPQNVSFNVDEYWTVHAIGIAQNGIPKFYPRERFIYFAYGKLYEHPWGLGDFQKAYRAWFIKGQIVIRWMQYLERNARGGIPIVTVATAVKEGQQAELESQLRKMFDGPLSHIQKPADMEIEWLNVLNATAGDAFHAAIKWCNEEIARAFLGSSLQVDEGSRVGSKAMASVHAKTGMSVMIALVRRVEAALNKQLLEPMVRANYPGVTEFPRIVLQHTTPEEFIAKFEALMQAIDRGIVGPTESWIRPYLNLEAPEEGEDTDAAAEAGAQKKLKEILGGKEAEEKGGKNEDQEEFADYKYSCLMAPLPRPVSDRIFTVGQTILDSELVDKGREGNPHVTVLYGLHTTNVADVQKVIGNFGKPIKIRLEAIGFFECEDYDVVKFDVHSDELVELNDLLRRRLDYTNDYGVYIPHATIAYVRKGEGMKYSRVDIDGTVATVNGLVFSTPDGERSLIPLEPPVAAVTPVEPPY